MNSVTLGTNKELNEPIRGSILSYQIKLWSEFDIYRPFCTWSGQNICRRPRIGGEAPAKKGGHFGPKVTHFFGVEGVLTQIIQGNLLWINCL